MIKPKAKGHARKIRHTDAARRMLRRMEDNNFIYKLYGLIVANSNYFCNMQNSIKLINLLWQYPSSA